jgi:transposase
LPAVATPSGFLKLLRGKKEESLPRRKVTFDTLRRMRELRQKGLTYREIGRRLKVSTATVSLYLGERRKKGILEGLRRRLRPC